MKQTFVFHDGSDCVIENAAIPMSDHFEKGHVTWVRVPHKNGESWIHLKYVAYVHEEEEDD